MNTHGHRLALMALMALIWGLIGVGAWAAEQEGGPTHFVGAFEDNVKPEMMDAYMKARAADAKLSAEYKFEFPFLTFVDGFRVTTCGIFTQFAQLDGFPQKMAAWNKKTGGKSEQINQQIAKCVGKASSSVVVFRPDLSYLPTNPAFTVDFSQPFYQVADFYHLKPDKYDQAEALARKVKELSEKKRSPMGYWIYECIFGPDVPTFIAITQAKDKASFVALDQKMQANPDPEMEKVFNDNVDVLTSIETTEGTFVPEASYVPKGTFGGEN